MRFGVFCMGSLGLGSSSSLHALSVRVDSRLLIMAAARPFPFRPRDARMDLWTAIQDIKNFVTELEDVSQEAIEWLGDTAAEDSSYSYEDIQAKKVEFQKAVQKILADKATQLQADVDATGQ